MVSRKRTVDKVDADREAVATIEERHRDRVAVIDGELRDLEATMGSAVLDAELAGAPDAAAALVARVASLTAERGVSERAAVAARGRLRDLQRERWQLEAVELRRQAAMLRSDAAVHETKGLELQAALEEWEDCTFEPTRPPTMAAKLDGKWMVGAEHGVDVVVVQTPLSVRMRHQADALDAQALELEQRQIQSAGGVEGDSVDEILAAVHALGVAVVPSDESIRTWVADQQREHGPAAERSRGGLRFALAWTEGRIDGRARTRVLTEYDFANAATRVELAKQGERNGARRALLREHYLADDLSEREARDRAHFDANEAEFEENEAAHVAAAHN